MRIESRLLSVLSLVAVVAVGACGGSDKKADTTTSSAAPPVTVAIGGVNAILRGTSVAADGLEIEIDDNYFKPNVLTGTPGQSVTLSLASEGASLHNFSLTEQQISKDIPAGTKATVKVVLPQSGQLVFFCKYHKDESGMVGALQVSS